MTFELVANMEFKFLILCSLVTCAFSAKLPSNFPRCVYPEGETDIPEFQECYIKSSELARPFLIEGLTDVGIPPIDNLVLPRVIFEQRTRAVSIACNLTNVVINGLENYRLSRFLFKLPPNGLLNGTIDLPYIKLNGGYDIDGRIFQENVSQSGQFKATLNDSRIDVLLPFVIYMHRGLKYMNFTDYGLEPKLGKAVGIFENLFGSNQLLNKATNSFLEDSTSLLLKTVQPDVLKIARNLIAHIAVALTKKLPLYEIFQKKRNK